MRNEQLWGEIERQSLTWADVAANTWGEFRPLSTAIDGLGEIEAAAVDIHYGKTNMDGIAETHVQGVRVEFSPSVIENSVDVIVSASVSRKAFADSMMKSLPLYYRKSEYTEEMLRVIARELRTLDFTATDFSENLFMDSTTSMIERWERIFGITPDPAKSYDFRREKLKAKIRAVGTTTRQMIQSVASSFSNGEVEVIEDNPKSKFILKFVGVKGLPKNMDDLSDIIEQIKPAHLAFEYSYTYNTWAFVESGTWADVAAKTWVDMQTYS